MASVKQGMQRCLPTFAQNLWIASGGIKNCLKENQQSTFAWKGDHLCWSWGIDDCHREDQQSTFNFIQKDDHLCWSLEDQQLPQRGSTVNFHFHVKRKLPLLIQGADQQFTEDQQSTFTIFMYYSKYSTYFSYMLLLKTFDMHNNTNLSSLLFWKYITNFTKEVKRLSTWRSLVLEKGLPMMHLAIPTMPFATALITSTSIVNYLYIDHWSAPVSSQFSHVKFKRFKLFFACWY